MKKVGTIIDNLRKGEKAPDRHENPYLKEAIHLSDYLYTQTELTEKISSLFNDMNKPFILEIGCYMGKNVAELALQNRHLNVLGIDITYKRVVKAARKLKKLNLDNGKIAICDGRTLLDKILPDKRVDGVCVFFPDPWPKDKHEKNRLLNKEFVNNLYKKLASNGFFWFKTDHELYFKETDKLLLDSGFHLDNVTNGETLSQPKLIIGGPYETAFQKLFTSKGVPFYQRVYIKV